jgi:hypothetical protein
MKKATPWALSMLFVFLVYLLWQKATSEPKKGF